MTSARQEKATTKSSIKLKLSALGNLIRGRGLERGSQYSESRLSIDYDQFCIRAADNDSQEVDLTVEERRQAPVPRMTAGKRFSESHINPDISFTVEGRLPETEELVLSNQLLPQAQKPSPHVNRSHMDLNMVDNDLYKINNEGSFRQSEPSHQRLEPLPVTCIDDVMEVSSDFDTYEQVRVC